MEIIKRYSVLLNWGMGHIHCVLESWARLALHVEPLRKQSKQEFTEKNKSLKWLFKTNVFSWDF
jgi:hypothetical protein